MFSYIASFLEFLTGGGIYTDDKVTNDHQESSSLENVGEDTSENISTFTDLTDVISKNKQSFNGKITSYFNKRGLINDHIYFTKGVVIGNVEPKVGDDVNVDASRSHSEGGWIASKVQIIFPWIIDNEEDNKPFKDFIIGNVSSINMKVVKIKAENELLVDMKYFKIGYKPLTGDWVNIEIWRKNDPNDIVNDITENDVISVYPLREKKINGCVTELLGGYGFINENIYCPFSACEHGYKLRERDEVTAIIMESKQRRGDWRALSVGYKPRNKNNKSNDYVDNDSSNPKCDNKHNISITDDINFGDIFVNETHKLEISVRNDGRQGQTFVKLKNVAIPGFACLLGPDLKAMQKNLVESKVKQSQLVKERFSKGKLLCPSMVISPGDNKIAPIQLQPKNLGKISFSLDFCFYGFNISRTVKANVIDKLQSIITNGSQPYKKPAPTFFGLKVNTSVADKNVIPGQRPIRKKKIFLPNKMAKYPIPSYLKDCILNCDGDIELLVPELAQPLHISNYKKKLDTLLYAEEIQTETEMRAFDLECVLLRQCGEYLSLAVPGLAEGRPSLLLGDRVIVSYHGRGTDSPCYEGYIHEVHAESIMLKFNEGFHNVYGNDDLDVEFHSNRTSVRREHQAVDYAFQMEEVLFPTSVIPKEPLVTLKKGSINPFNKLLNERQIMAVSRIVAGCGRPIPYILFGPPGTGKTVTVVESILQIFTYVQYSRILVCAPSNSAADLIAERLHNSGLLLKSDMIRINAFQRSKLGIPEVIEQYCSKDTDDLKLVSRHRIIVMTCNMAGFLYSFDLKVGHFTHVLVDEAGQATEPECLIPAGFAAGCEEAQIVLSGDPFQLGPVLRSDIAQDYGLNISFLERLTLSKLYERNEELYADCGNYNPLVVTKLINNYRSHPQLLKLSSSMFYNCELIPCADEKMVNLCIGSDILPNSGSPFIFHGLRGEDHREGNSPSWFNPMEAVQVLKYVQIIMKSFKVDVDGIGIITPYRKQVEKIRVLLEKFDLSDIKVGSVEEFQGQERLCIIISTVRSNETFVNFDCLHNIGFLSNPKRFNVAITRGQALLVIIGNPVVLCHDPYWCAMLQYAVMTGSYTGCDLPPLSHEVIQENFKKAMYLLGLNNEVTNSSIEETTNTMENNLNKTKDEYNINEKVTYDERQIDQDVDCVITKISHTINLNESVLVSPKTDICNTDTRYQSCLDNDDGTCTDLKPKHVGTPSDKKYSNTKRVNAMLASLKKTSPNAADKVS